MPTTCRQHSAAEIDALTKALDEGTRGPT